MTKKPKVLLIDDEVDFTELLAENLEDSGYVVRQVNDPTKALAAARSFLPDICVIDLVMPRMDGGDVVTALVEESPDDPGELQMKGGLPFISKTSDLEVIINGIKTQLGQH
jgi:CheY-like chemotaxis protein